MEQTGTTPADTSPQAQVDENQSTPSADEVDGASSQPPGFQSRGRARRRARFLRKARELAYRDLGGLVFNLHRFGQRNDALVLAKLTTLDQIDTELRSIEASVGERRPITVLREAGITACPRCAAIHGSDDRFCPNCGLAIGRHVDLPAELRSGASAPAPWSATTPSVQAPAPAAAGAPAATQPAVAPPPAAPAAPPTPRAESAPAAASAAEEQTAGGENEPTEILRPPGGGT